VAVLPAGTGHRLIEASPDFLVVGAYPEDGTYDECTDTRDRPDAIKRIAQGAQAGEGPGLWEDWPTPLLPPNHPRRSARQLLRKIRRFSLCRSALLSSPLCISPRKC
jgi:hypothetical protein